MTATATINTKKGTMGSRAIATGSTEDSSVHDTKQDHSKKEKGYKGSGKRTNDTVYETKREQYLSRMNELDSEIGKGRAKLSHLNEQISNILNRESNKGVRGELLTKIQSLKSQRQSLEEARAPILGKLKDLQHDMKTKQDELATAKEKLPLKRVEDIDKKIMEIEHQLETGSVGKLIEEKRMVAEVTKLKKNRKALEALTNEQRAVDSIKRELDTTRALLNEKEHIINGIRDQIKKVSSELNALPDDKNSKQSKIQSLISEKEETKKRLDHLHGEKNLCYTDFQTAREAHESWMEQDRLRRDEFFKRKEIENEIAKLRSEMENLDLPPCIDQINGCENLQHYLKTNILRVPVATNNITTNETNAKVPPVLDARKVEKMDKEEFVPLKKLRDENEDSLYVLEGHSQKHNKKKAGTNTNSTFKLPFWVVAGLEELGVGVVTTLEQVEDAVNKLDQVKHEFEKKQHEQLKTVDDKRDDIQNKIQQQQKRLENIASEVAEARANQNVNNNGQQYKKGKGKAIDTTGPRKTPVPVSN